jgi:hypothetical protein
MYDTFEDLKVKGKNLIIDRLLVNRLFFSLHVFVSVKMTSCIVDPDKSKHAF